MTEHTEHVSEALPVRRKKRGPRMFAAALVVIIAAYFVWQHTHKAAAPPAVLVPVNAGHPVLHDFPIRIAAVGTVQPLNTIDMKVRVDGQLQKIAFVEGQDVNRGDVIAQIDPRPLEAQVQQARATQRKDAASLANAQRDLKRYQQLAGIGATTTQTVDTAKAQVDGLSATVAADAAVVRNDELQLSFTTLNAPFSGRLGARQVDVGSIVHASDTTGIVTLTQMAPINVTFSVPQDQLPAVLDQQRRTPLTVTATNHADNSTLANGKLTFIDSTVDVATGQIKMKGLFPNDDRKLWPGELVNARILVETLQQQIAVPARAVVNGSNGTTVFVIDGQGVAALRPVRTGVTVDGLTQIVSGVKGTDLVAFDGQSRLNPGTRVKVTQIAATADTAASTSDDLAGE